MTINELREFATTKLTDNGKGEILGSDVRTAIVELCDQVQSLPMWKPVFGLVNGPSNTVVMKVVSWLDGPNNPPPVNQYLGSNGLTTDIAQAINVRGIQGLQGLPGNKAWSPVLSNVADGTRIVQQVTDWIGGEGAKPSVTPALYVSTSGFTSDITVATNIRGQIGVNWRTDNSGNWAAATSYAVNEGVYNGGNSYRRIIAGVSGSAFDATEAANWKIIAQGGAPADGTVTESKLDAPTAAKLNGAYSYTDAAVAGVFSPPVIDGYNVVGKGKLNSGSYLLQPCVAFDLTNIAWASGASFVFSAKIKTKNANISAVSMRYYVNNVASISDVSGTQSPTNGSVSLTNGVLNNYSNTKVWSIAKQNYIHCYFDFVLPDNLVSGEVLLYDIALSVNGVTAPRVAGGMVIYSSGSGDSVTTITTLSEPAATQAFTTTKKAEAITASNAYTDIQVTNLLNPPTIDGFLVHAKGNTYYPTLIQPWFAFNLSAIAWASGASFTFSCKLYSKSGNIINVQRIRTYWNNIATVDNSSGIQASYGTTTALTTNVSTSYTVSGVINTAQTSYVHLVLDLGLTDSALVGDIIVYDLSFTIAGSVAPRLAGSALFSANAGDTVTATTSISAPLATQVYADTKKAESLTYTDAQVLALKNITAVDGYRVVGVGNSVNTTLVQATFIFDTNAISWAVGDSVALSVKLIARNGNITRINAIRLFTNTSTDFTNLGGADGNMGAVSATPTNGVPLTYTASRAASVAARYIHVFVDVVLTTPTTQTIFDLFDPVLTVKGSTAVKLAGGALYSKGANDSITGFSYLDDALANVAYVNAQRDAAKAYADTLTAPKLKGKKWNAQGDSITYGHGVGVNGTYRAILAAKWGMTARNYGISGTCLAGTSNAYGASMATRYSSMDDDADYITVFGMTNDWTAAIPIGSNSDTTVDTLKGALNVLCKGLIEKYPAKKIGLITPLNHRTTNNSAGLSVLNYCDAMIEIGALWSIPVLDLYRKGGVLPINTVQRGAVMYDSNSDGVGDDVQHPGPVGHAMLADRVEAFLLSL